VVVVGGREREGGTPPKEVLEHCERADNIIENPGNLRMVKVNSNISVNRTLYPFIILLRRWH
jgi:hypothetical protein